MKSETEKSKPIEEPVVLRDECGDSMWDAVLDQSPFIQALRQAAEKVPEIKKTIDM